MEKVSTKSKLLTKRPTGYCPGCLHGVVTKLIAESIDELGQRCTLTVLPIGCSTLGMPHLIQIW